MLLIIRHLRNHFWFLAIFGGTPRDLTNRGRAAARKVFVAPYATTCSTLKPIPARIYAACSTVAPFSDQIPFHPERDPGTPVAHAIPSETAKNLIFRATRSLRKCPSGKKSKWSFSNQISLSIVGSLLVTMTSVASRGT